MTGSADPRVKEGPDLLGVGAFRIPKEIPLWRNARSMAASAQASRKAFVIPTTDAIGDLATQGRIVEAELKSRRRDERTGQLRLAI